MISSCNSNAWRVVQPTDYVAWKLWLLPIAVNEGDVLTQTNPMRICSCVTRCLNTYGGGAPHILDQQTPNGNADIMFAHCPILMLISWLLLQGLLPDQEPQLDDPDAILCQSVMP